MLKSKQEKSPVAKTSLVWTVVTSNIWLGGAGPKLRNNSLKSTKKNLSELSAKENLLKLTKKIIAEEPNLSILALQEVDIRNKRSDNIDGPKYIAQVLGDNFAENCLFAEALRRSNDSQYGNALVSKLKFSKTLSPCSLGNKDKKGKVQTWVTRDKRVKTEENRVACAGKFLFMERTNAKNDELKYLIWVVTTHLGLGADVRENQLLLLMAYVKTLSNEFPLIVCGDFNIRACDDEYSKLVSIFGGLGIKPIPLDETSKSINNGFTMKNAKIDHMFFRNGTHERYKDLKVSNCRTIDLLEHSDHKAVATDIFFSNRR